MKTTQPPLRKTLASLASLALLTFGSSAFAALTVTLDNQNGPAPFTPTWTPASGSLIAGLGPTLSQGSFDQGTGGNLAVLTAGGSLTIPAGYIACGNGAGNLLEYTLPPSANGYDITNITTYSGWNDGGRDGQGYTVYYATAGNPGVWIALPGASFRNDGPSVSQPSANRVTIQDSAGGVLAAHVAAVLFDFGNPGVENGWVGMGAITVQGTASAGTAAPPPITISGSVQSGANPFTPSWTAETPDLIAGLSPLTPPSSATGFNNETCAGLGTLTDGAIGVSGNEATMASCGANGGNVLVYDLTAATSANGADVTNIVTYSGWGDGGRYGQYYILSYATVSAPTTYIPLTTVYYLPATSGAPAARVAVSTSTGAPLAKNVASLKFDFGGPPEANRFNNAWQGYSEIIVQGANSAAPTVGPSPYLTMDTLPSYAETVVGDTVVFTAAYSNVPPASLQWLVVKAGVTNTIPGATNTTLTLATVQTTDSGFYKLKAINSTDGTALPSFSTPAQLVVGTAGTAGNIAINYAGQMFPNTTNYFPPWTVDTNSLIYGFTFGSGPGTFNQVGSFGGSGACNPDATIMSDGMAGSFTSVPTQIAVAGGPTIYNVGSSITYTLNNPGSYGYDLTNISVFGGWQDEGRDEQKYQILYATVSTPNTFVPLVTADYAPATVSGNLTTVTRTSLTPLTGVLVHNVVAVKLNFDVSPAPKNGWEGYTEFIVQGMPSGGFAPGLVNDVAPRTATDVVGGQITMGAQFANYTSVQWQKNGTNLIGATSTNLTLSNLSTNDAGTYALVASNPFGSTSSGGCLVTVNPAPPPVGNLLTAIAAQTSDAQVFTPTWPTNGLGASLIAGAAPSATGPGDFSGAGFTPPTDCSDPSILTDGSFGTADFYVTTEHLCWTAMGTGTAAGNASGGQSVTYTLPPSANGYDITNIMTAGGWNDGGRDQQAYTVFYSTLQNPDMFLQIGTVNYTPANPVGYSVTRATLTPVSGALAHNVQALRFDMNYPRGENGFEGYSEFAVYGTPSATPPPPVPVITAQNEQVSFDYVVETNNLIANQLPSSTGPGVFTEEGCNVTNLTDGMIGFGAAYGASCGDDGTAVPWLIFNAPTGWDLTNIVVYSLWNDYGRDGQFYTVSYSTLTAPSTFVPLATVGYNPDVIENGIASANRVDIAPMASQTALATNVAAVKFDFTSQGIQDYGWTGYSEIVLQGSSLVAAATPVLNSPIVSNGNLILTGMSATLNYGYTVLGSTNLTTPLANWSVIATGVTSGSGVISNAIPIIPGQPASFFRVRMP